MTRTISFDAMPYPIPAEYKEQLSQLGNECLRLRNLEKNEKKLMKMDEYVKACTELDIYLNYLRGKLAVPFTRLRFESVQKAAKVDNDLKHC